MYFETKPKTLKSIQQAYTYYTCTHTPHTHTYAASTISFYIHIFCVILYSFVVVAFDMFKFVA